jgi:aspartyl-tRNA(Asn)/glutamyl-tRNA(Gln) amidotransferase subunit C
MDGSERLTKESVAHLAWLARIELSDQEQQRFTAQLNTILEHFAMIDHVDTRDVRPTFHTFDLVNVMRDDDVEPCLTMEEALQNAPRREQGYFKAPRIV